MLIAENRMKSYGNVGKWSFRCEVSVLISGSFDRGVASNQITVLK